MNKKVEKIMKDLNIEQMSNSYARELSGGQKKLLELGRSLIKNPEVLLLDEPLAGVNPKLAEDLLQKIQNSPAEDAGVKEQDVIIEVDGEKVNDSSNLKNLISSGRPNDKTKLTVIRDGREKYLTVILGLRPGEKELAETYRYGEKLFDILGLRVETFENRDPKNLDYVNGVKIVEVKKDSPAFDNNINRGDIITEMGKTSIKEKNEYDLELESYSKGNTIMLRIVRNGNPLYVAFEIE